VQLLKDGKNELGREIARYRAAFITVAVLSACLNVLLLGGSIYMMMVYDSVLPSHSLPSLFGLLAMLIIVFIFQALFDSARSRILMGVGAGLERALGGRVQRAMGDASLRMGDPPGDGLVAVRDLDNVRNFLSSGGPTALIDLPWIVFFIAILSLLHIWLGVAALVGSAILVGLTLLNDRTTSQASKRVTELATARSGAAERNLRHVEVLSALGMRERMRWRWEVKNQEFLSTYDSVTRSANRIGSISRVFRLFLQSFILTVGALLVIDGLASGGVIFAASVLFGRAVAPVDQAIANWRNFAAARAGWTRLNNLLSRFPETEDGRVILPLPQRDLAVQQLALAPPGQKRLTVLHAHFNLRAGDVLGIIGPSGAGKTSLGRALVGVWQPQRGSVRLDGSTFDQWDSDRLGSAIGYLPQGVELIEGTIAENISRFAETSDSLGVIEAARAAGVHDVIVQFPQGYDTMIGRDGSGLSAGQRQRIGLARALYGDPFLVVLDEPNSNLDQEGEHALQGAIASVRERDGIVVLITHRPALLAETNKVMFMRNGKMELFGDRDEVLQKVLARGPAPVPQVGGRETAAQARAEA